MAKIKFYWRSSDDFCDVFLDDELLFTVDYDTYGRAGQSEMLDAIRKIADKAGWEISDSEETDDSD